MRGPRGARPPRGDAVMGLVQGSGIETGGWRPFLDEVSQDLEDLCGVGDHGDDFHGVVTARAAQGVRIIDLPDQAGPRGATLELMWRATKTIPLSIIYNRERKAESRSCLSNTSRRSSQPATFVDTGSTIRESQLSRSGD